MNHVKSLWNHMKPHEITWDHKKSQEIIRNHKISYEIIRNHKKSYGIIRNHMRSYRLYVVLVWYLATPPPCLPCRAKLSINIGSLLRIRLAHLTKTYTKSAQISTNYLTTSTEINGGQAWHIAANE